MFTAEELLQIQKSLEFRIESLENHVLTIQSWPDPHPVELGLLLDLKESIKAARSAYGKIPL